MLHLPIWKKHMLTMENKSSTKGCQQTLHIPRTMCLCWPAWFSNAQSYCATKGHTHNEAVYSSNGLDWSLQSPFLYSPAIHPFLQDTLQAKKAVERYCEPHGVKVMHYHADNGRFVDHAFIEDIKLQNQKVTYCSINAHFQNRVAEKHIWDLHDLTCTAMLHTSAC